MKGIMKFEGENRLTLHTVIYLLSKLVGEPDLKKVKKQFFEAIKKDLVVETIAKTILFLKNENQEQGE